MSDDTISGPGRVHRGSGRPGTSMEIDPALLVAAVTAARHGAGRNPARRSEPRPAGRPA
ncbi:hypothetical protein [Streptomyces sp. NPDC048191]|uniref:hypothetical protein n=1 Tax=Streptomyces sp. NPDC048191 TaxID=3155484 RepID=UPI0033D74CAA